MCSVAANCDLANCAEIQTTRFSLLLCRVRESLRLEGKSGGYFAHSPPPKAGSARAACLGLYQFVTPRMETLQLFQTPVLVFSPIHNKKFLLTFKWKFLCLSLYRVSFYFPHQVFIHVEKLPKSLLPALSASLGTTDAQVRHGLHGSLLDLLQYVHVSLVLGSPAQVSALQGWLHRAEQREGSPLLSCWQCSASCSPEEHWPSLLQHCWLMFHLVSTRTPGPFPLSLITKKYFLQHCKRTLCDLLHFI